MATTRRRSSTPAAREPPVGHLPLQPLAQAGRNLTRAEWDQFVGGDYRRTCPQWLEGVA